MDVSVRWPCPERGVQRTPLPEDFVLRRSTCELSVELAPDVDPDVESVPGENSDLNAPITRLSEDAGRGGDSALSSNLCHGTQKCQASSAKNRRGGAT